MSRGAKAPEATEITAWACEITPTSSGWSGVSEGSLAFLCRARKTERRRGLEGWGPEEPVEPEDGKDLGFF